MLKIHITSPQHHHAGSRNRGSQRALALVITTADADRVHTTAVAFRLGMHLGIAIDLTGARHQQARSTRPPDPACCRYREAGFGSLHRVELIVHRRGRAGQMPDPIHFQLDRLGDVDGRSKRG